MPFTHYVTVVGKRPGPSIICARSLFLFNYCYNQSMEPSVANIPNNFYRVSIKALILNETGKKFAVVLENNGLWEVPGGGLDWGESPTECITREIHEEMGLTVIEVGSAPLYYLLGKNMKGFWSLNLVFEVKVKDLNFTPSEECRELKFVSPEEVESMNAFRTVKELAVQFAQKNKLSS